MDTAAQRAALWDATQDTNSRVVGHALLGLYRLGEAATIRLMLEMVQHPLPLFRSTAAWVLGETGDPRFCRRWRAWSAIATTRRGTALSAPSRGSSARSSVPPRRRACKWRSAR